MVNCLIPGCGNRTGRLRADRRKVKFYRVPRVITFQGEFTHELTATRRTLWLSAIGRDDLTETKLENNRVCSQHFVSGQPSQNWDRSNVDWVPTLNLSRTTHAALTAPDSKVGGLFGSTMDRLSTTAGERRTPRKRVKKRHLEDGEKRGDETMVPSTSKRACVSTSVHSTSGGVSQHSHGDSEGDGNPPMTGIVGFSKETTLALLPRMYMEELLSELDRRNIVVKLSGGNRPRGRDDLEHVLKEVMMKEYEEWDGVSDADEDMSTNGSLLEQNSPVEKDGSQAEDCNVGGTPNAQTHPAELQVKIEPGEEDSGHCATSTSAQKRHTVNTEPSTSQTGHSGLGDGSQLGFASAPTTQTWPWMVKIKTEPGVEEQPEEQQGNSMEPSVEEQLDEELDASVQPGYSVEPSYSVEPGVEEQPDEEQAYNLQPTFCSYNVQSSFSVEPSVEEQPKENLPDNVDVSSDAGVSLPGQLSQELEKVEVFTAADVPPSSSTQSSKEAVGGTLCKNRFATLDEEQLDEIEEGRVEKTTEKSTKWGVKLFKAWLKARDQNTEFEALPPQELAQLLRKFYGEVRKDDGTPYSKASYACLRAAIHRHLTGPPYHCKYNILKDNEFQAANNLYIGVLKKLKRDGMDTAKPHPPILACDISKMFETKTLSVDNPVSLQRLVYFYLSFYLCRKGRETLRNLKISDFVGNTDGGRKYYTLRNTEDQKNRPSNSQPSPRLYASSSGTRPCPVQVFELYCSKLHNRCPFLFQRPNLQWKLESHARAPWYHGQPVGHNKMGTMMRDISKAAGLSKSYTNHSVRITAIQALNETGFKTRVIMSLSGHRNESSVRRCTHDCTERQKEECSHALGAALDPH